MPLFVRRTAILLSVLCVLPVQADVAAVIAYLDGLERFAADFTQTRYDEEGTLLERASGTARIARPGRFRWTYAEPLSQLIVSDGQTLWIHDEDLEQVTVSAVDDSGAGSPAALLGRERDVAAHYEVTVRADAGGGLAWYRLAPRGAGGDFTAVELGFADNEVRAMRLTDNLGQLTTLEFSAIVRNGDLDEAQFRFVPPPGVDVVQGGMP